MASVGSDDTDDDDSDDADNRVIPEGLFVVISVCALIITAIILPPVDGGVLSDPRSIGDTPDRFDTATRDISSSRLNPESTSRESDSGQTVPPTADPQSQSESSRKTAQSTRSGYGSPEASTLDQPPASMAIGSTRPRSGKISKIPVFTVESPRTGYWRQSVYTTYTGSTWVSKTESQSYTGAIPNNERTIEQQTTTYEVTSLQETSSLPVLWQLETVNIQDGSTEMQISTAGTVETSQTLPRETTYTAQSAAPPRDPDILTDAGNGYPNELSRQYTQIPEDTPSRVTSLTENITSDAETPYETATVIERWLEDSKAYSLNASHERGRPIVDEFLFEMNQGYCQYFATAMTVMLRSQDIPARYVVGYKGGTQVAEDRYLITSDTGHAWVEVYFPDVGWIRFDPTPPGDLPIQNPQPPYNITLNRTVVAGATVDISVEKNTNPVTGAPVRVNTERVGWTDATGTITTQLPYANTVTVSARPPGDQGKYLNEQTVATVEDMSLPAVGEIPRLRGSSRQYKLSVSNEPLRSTNDSGCSIQSETALKCQSETNVSVDVTGSTVRGKSVVVSTSIRGVPVQNGTVAVDGDIRGYTNNSGEFTLVLDNVTTGTHSISVTRQAASGTATIRVLNASSVSKPTQTQDSASTLPPTSTSTPASTPVTSSQDNTSSINITVTPQFGVLVPLTNAGIIITQSNTPVSNATVTLSGSAVGQTGPNGTVDATVPLQQSASITVVGPDNTRAQQTISGLYRTTAGIILGILLFAVAGIMFLYRNRDRIRIIIIRIHTTLTQTPMLVTDMFVRLTLGIDHVWSWFRQLSMQLRKFILAPRGHLSLDRLTDMRLLSPRQIASIVYQWLRSLMRALRNRNQDQMPQSEEGISSSSESDVETADAQSIIRKLWYVFTRAVGPSRLRTKTPREVATYAIEQGVPSKPVTILTQMYRKAEYGVESTTESQLESARDAFQTIRNALGKTDK